MLTLKASLTMATLIIVGAGASGLAAASRLVEKGFDPDRITILEAENRIGGRIHTVPHGNFIYFKDSNIFCLKCYLCAESFFKDRA